MSPTTRNSRVSQRRDMGWILHPRWHDDHHHDDNNIDIEHDIQHNLDQLQYDDDLDQHHHDHNDHNDYNDNGCAMHRRLHMAMV